MHTTIYPVEEEMAGHSSILAWEIPWTEEPGGLQSMGLQRIRHDLTSKPPPAIWDHWEAFFLFFFNLGSFVTHSR